MMKALGILHFPKAHSISLFVGAETARLHGVQILRAPEGCLIPLDPNPQ